ncbi:K+/H+ antiporter subunit F [Bartonella sp. HY329]|uniref:K+/H+ antiporter subunit F n=1 Tax=unclassified Bartonella TaxID=2645622 RepID=UPI0021C660B3|nr:MULTISPECIES: K+/H+ antiporter subunit F [unclassified Bartonella]UXM95750.1 K+/H+ antiporter subunit F [Bartonella sp. HY329]UXN10075.1 K+/H+ antiporter subunit F [Bartonella sp. HY328]
MSYNILFWALLVSQAMVGLAILLASYRLIFGPRAQDRIMGLDTLYVTVMIMLLLFGIRTGTAIYFESALVIGMLGFVSSIALAKFLMRGEVIE